MFKWVNAKLGLADIVTIAILIAILLFFSNQWYVRQIKPSLA